jgi:glycerophosphoryl diester phosphodiesterase
MINYAHRGASAYAPENTLAAFYLGCEMGATGIETDVQKTQDGTLVLFHDDSLARLFSLNKRIADMRWDELSSLDFGAYMGQAKYAGERIVTLDQFLFCFGAKPLQLAIEIKQPGIEREVLAMMAQHRVLDHATMTSFDWDTLTRVRALNERVPIGFLTERITSPLLCSMLAAKFQQVCPRIDLLQAEDVLLARKHGLSIRAWGVATPALMHKAIALRLDGMTVNFPDKLSEALRIG